MPKSPAAVRQARRHNPLDEDLLARGLLRQKAPKRKAGDDKEEENYVDARATKQILDFSRELADEGNDKTAAAKQEGQVDAFGLGSRFTEAEEQPEAFDGRDDEWSDDDDATGTAAAGDANADDQVNPTDLATFSKFNHNEMEEDPILKNGLRLDISGQKEAGAEEKDEAMAPPPPGSRNLADIIMAKIAEHEGGRGFLVEDGYESEPEKELDPRVLEIYARCGQLLARWKSGKLPKPLKVLPSFPDWEELIEVTEPHNWSPNACYEMTKIFISAKAHIGTAFLEMVILDRVRDDIREHKELNVHLFAALKKSLFRPAAFFKGFLFPLILSGSTTLREAQIVCAVLVRTTIPVLHSSAAIEGLCDLAAELPPNAQEQSPISVFIKALLDKRYALPYQVIDCLVIHFLRARTSDTMPVTWHQSFLLFTQRYRDSLTEEQREMLMDLLLKHNHPDMGKEIRRELVAGRNRGEAAKAEVGWDGDDTMLIDA